MAGRWSRRARTERTRLAAAPDKACTFAKIRSAGANSLAKVTPGWVGRVSTRTRTPLRATVMVTAVVLGLAVLAPLGVLAQLTSALVLADKLPDRITDPDDLWECGYCPVHRGLKRWRPVAAGVAQPLFRRARQRSSWVTSPGSWWCFF